MTKDDIIRMAREAGINFREHLKDFHSPWCDGIHMDEFKRFAKLIAEAEREACAKLCEEQEQRSRKSSEKSKRERDQFMYHHCSVTAKWNAAVIRARREQ